MKILYITLILILTFLSSQAHPGIGLVYDGNESIFYTDLNHVWKLDIQTGESEIYVKDIHTHELYLDKSGNLYGEHYWYIESEEKFQNFIWQVDKNGKFHKIRKNQYGENNDFSFIRDDSFSSFQIRKVNDKFEIVKTDSLSKTILHKPELSDPTWKYLTENEELLFIDFPSIYLTNNEGVNLMAKDISSKRFPFSTQGDRHNIYGIWTDNDENIYVAIYGGREVKKIDNNGDVHSILKSSFLWSPVNGVFDKDDNLWLMECQIGGKIRVRKINQSEIPTKASFTVENSVLISILLIGFFLLYQRIKGNKINQDQQPV